MEWEAIQALAEIVAAIGVIVSLVYLAGQVRQNTRSNAAATNQALLANYMALVSHSWQSPSGAHLYANTMGGTWEALSTEDQAAGRQMWLGAMRLFDHAYQQHQAGLIAGEAWTAWKKQMLLSVATPGFRSTWPGIRLLMTPSFAEWIDTLGEDASQLAIAYRDGMEAGGMDVLTLGDRKAAGDP